MGRWADKLLGQDRALPYIPASFGVYLNLVEGLLWVQDVGGSNPPIPTIRVPNETEPLRADRWSGGYCRLAKLGVGAYYVGEPIRSLPAPPP